MGYRRDEARSHLVPRALEARDEFHRMVGAQQAEIVGGSRELMRLSLMHNAFAEFVHRADMVHVSVSRNREQRILEEILCGGFEAGDTHAGIDQHVLITAADVPD